MKLENHALAQAVSCIDNGTYDLALSKLDELLAKQSACALALYLRAVTLKARHDDAAADADFCRAVGSAHRGSVADFKDMLRWQPGNAIGHYNRACAFHIEGDLEPAINNYGETIRLDNDHAGALLNRGLAYASRNRTAPPGSRFGDYFDGEFDRENAMHHLRVASQKCASGRVREIAERELRQLEELSEDIIRRSKRSTPTRR